MRMQRTERIITVMLLLLAVCLGAWTCDPQPSEPLCIGDWECGHDEYCNIMSVCESNDIGFHTIIKAGKAGINERLLVVIRDQMTWTDFWPLLQSDITSGNEAPEIDFERNMVVVLTTGLRNSSGYNISIQKITRHSEGMTIHFTEHQPGPNCPVTKVDSNPYVVLILEKYDGDLNTDADVINYACQ